MTTIKNAYINALLANASYVRLQEGEVGDPPSGILVTGKKLTERLTADLTQPQADYLLANFDILTQTLSPTGGFDATVWKGKAGTEFAGQVYVSMRGTAGGQDISDDITLAARGIPYEQIRDMANWWLKATGKPGDVVKQIKIESVVTPSTLVNGMMTPSLTSYTFAAGTAVTATGELYGQVGTIQAVNGHSLGGYLATAFTRLFGVQANVTQTSTFNSAGFLAGSESASNDATWQCAA